ncbi:MAG: hypothetical protein UIG52_06625 [Bacteroidales bacterium]|nr:hypothetical protein [Bacteroidales bacterium]
MKKYTREEIIAELAQNVSVMFDGYGTWKIKSYIGQRETYRYCANHYVEVSEITHNEEDKTGIFDGETYNPQNFDDWYFQVFSYELPEDDEPEYYNDEELQEKFKEYCEAVWADSANEDNYESGKKRDLRLAERLFDCLIEDDKVIECVDGYLILTEAEAEFLGNNYGWIEDLYEGKLDDFAEAFERWEEEK